MKTIILVCAVCLNLGESYGLQDTDGVGAFAYDGPSGRYGGTYGLKDGQVVNQQGNLPPNFSPPTFPDHDDFVSAYFDNLENILQETSPFIRPPPFTRFSPYRRSFSPFFERTFDNVDNQRLAYAAATKAFDLTSNRAASNQYFAPFRFPFGGYIPGFDGFPGQGFPGQGFQGQGFPGQGFQGQRFQGYPGQGMPNFRDSENRAYAGAAFGPGYTHQVADITPANPNNPNINKYSKDGSQPGGFKEVISSASSSSGIDSQGRKTESRRAETIVNDNGVITKYKVQS